MSGWIGHDPAGVEYNSRGQRPRKSAQEMIVTLKGSQMPRQDATPSGSGKILAVDPGALPPAITLDAFSVLTHPLTCAGF